MHFSTTGEIVGLIYVYTLLAF